MECTRRKYVYVFSQSGHFPVVLKSPFILVEAPELVDFWQENFKVQIEARTGVIRLIQPGMNFMLLVCSYLLT